MADRPEKEMDRNGMDMEQFGSFITQRRRELGLTQKELAEKLFVSNKAVSKWERAQSMPDIALLEPLAGALGVSVEELLHGRLQPREVSEEDFTEAGIRQLLQESEEVSGKNKELRRKVRKKRAKYYFSGMILSVAEVAALYLVGGRFGINAEDVSLDVLIINPIIMFFGMWTFFFMPEKLPSYYDKTRISGFSDGFFRMNVPGVYFNNRNWPHIAGAMRKFCFLEPICWPAAYLLIRMLVPDSFWHMGRMAVLLLMTLGGLFLPVLICGRKYD